MLVVRCYSLIPGPSPPPGRPRRPSSPGLQPLNSSHFTDSLSGTRLFSRARNRWLERHPGKPGRRRPQRPSSAGDPCPSKTRTPRETPEMSGGDLYRGQRMALATNLPAASRLRTPRRPPPRSLQPPRGPALGPSCSGDTEGDPRHVPTARTEAPPGRPGRRPQHPAYPPREGAPGLRARGGASAASAEPGGVASAGHRPTCAGRCHRGRWPSVDRVGTRHTGFWPGKTRTTGVRVAECAL